MLMPIVSMNKMAMNESVATTCCYRQVSTPTAVYWEVLHGGWIGSGYRTDLVWRDGWSGINATWLEWGNDVTGLTDAAMQTVLTNSRIGLVQYDVPPTGWTATTSSSSVGWAVTDSLGAVNAPVAAWLAGNGYGSRACDHKGGTCRYRTLEYNYHTNQHFESTTSHAGITAWADPHDARAFSS